MKSLNRYALIFFILAAIWIVLGIFSDISDIVSFGTAVIFIAIGSYYQFGTTPKEGK